MQISHNKDFNKSNHQLKIILRRVENWNWKKLPVFTKMKINWKTFDQIYIII